MLTTCSFEFISSQLGSLFENQGSRGLGKPAYITEKYGN